MAFAKQCRTDIAATQTVIPALSRDPWRRRKSGDDDAPIVLRFGATEEWAPGQARGDDRVFGVSPERANR
jgi:hypothetical protein